MLIGGDAKGKLVLPEAQRLARVRGHTSLIKARLESRQKPVTIFER